MAKINNLSDSVTFNNKRSDSNFYFDIDKTDKTMWITDDSDDEYPDGEQNTIHLTKKETKALYEALKLVFEGDTK